MQLLVVCRLSYVSMPCSTLRRVEPHATALVIASLLANKTCSTLRRVEPNATACTCSIWTRATTLAVPSDGSNLMQPRGIACRTDSRWPCSTLRRVEPNATKISSWLCLHLHNLQYPQTGRT